MVMTWTKPRIRVVSLALEINGYAVAELGDSTKAASPAA